jgi:hypothetical protein
MIATLLLCLLASTLARDIGIVQQFRLHHRDCPTTCTYRWGGIVPIMVKVARSVASGVLVPPGPVDAKLWRKTPDGEWQFVYCTSFLCAPVLLICCIAVFTHKVSSIAAVRRIPLGAAFDTSVQYLWRLPDIPYVTLNGVVSFFLARANSIVVGLD